MELIDDVLMKTTKTSTDNTDLDQHGWTPATSMLIDTIHPRLSTKPFLALIDPGSSHTLLNRRSLPAGLNPIVSGMTKSTTAHGEMQVPNEFVELTGFRFPDLSTTRRITDTYKVRLMDSPTAPYDVIVGRDILDIHHWTTNFATKTIHWGELSTRMRRNDRLLTPFFLHDDLEADETMDSFYSTADGKIKHAKYEKVEISNVIKEQQHLTKEQRDQLFKVLSSVNRLFSGELGVYPHKKIHLELKEGAEGTHCKAFPVPRVNADVFKAECARLQDVGVLDAVKVGATEHAYPTFIIPKKDGTVRWISDFRKLNAILKRKVFPLPSIQDTLTKRPGYRYFTKIDISMCYYTFELDDESSWLCVIVTPFGKFRYRRLPMGIACAPDICQEIMSSIFDDRDDVDVYLDDIGIWSNDYDTHMKTIETVLQRLDSNGFTVNPLKCEWAVQETDWLGYWLTPTGLKPWKKKIQPLLNLEPPKNLQELRRFIGAVNYYRSMYPHRSHILAPLTSLTGQRFEWTDIHQQAFLDTKAMLATETLNAYPNHNKPFDIYTDASNYQLGAVIVQENKPVAYYSRKLNAAQKNYTTMEKELLSIVETLREYRSMLFGASITIHTDHRNLTYTNLNTQRVLRWRLYLEEFGATYKYIKGEDNIIADFLSRASIKSAEADSAVNASPTTHSQSMFHQNDTLLSCIANTSQAFYLSLPKTTLNPIDYRYLQRLQQQQTALWGLPTASLPANTTFQYSFQDFGGISLVCIRHRYDHNFKIVIPDHALNYMVSWYHVALGHVGEQRLIGTMSQHLYHSRLAATVRSTIRPCLSCQLYKLPGRGYGHLAPREARVLPFSEVAVDLIGPWTVTVNEKELRFHALTIIDEVSTLSELVRIKNKESEHVAWKFEQAWLSRYPRPNRLVRDPGTEFRGDFNAALSRAGIHGITTTVRNAPGNSICERMHQTVGDIIRVLCHTHHPQTTEEAEDIVDRALATAQLALRTVVHSTLGASPGAIVFHRDMLLEVPYVADLLMMRDNRQAMIDYSVRRENSKRYSYDYSIGDFVLEVLPKEKRAKLSAISRGPYQVLRVHTNGTITIQRAPGEEERVNIRNFKPCRT
jgi:transposase InsO family protein